MDEISADDLYKGLLAYGFFAEKLPPVFTGVMFFNYCNTKNPIFNSKWHDYISFNSMRNTNIPRQLGIPTPMKYQKLCACLRDNWSFIQNHFHAQTDQDSYRVSRIHIRKMVNNDALFEMNYKDWRVDGNPETDLLFQSYGASKYLVEADISTCFPSIYSHSLPWSLVGKEEAKKHIGDTSKWYNQIDIACQELRNGETHGLLIGPHSSNLLAELILTAVDRKLQDKGDYHYFRNIDDYDCYVNSYDEAQRYLRDLEEALKEFDLPLNHKKTKILELPVANTANWIHRLNNVPLVAPFGKTTYKEVNAYLDIALQLMKENDDAAVLKYAIKTLSGQNLTDNAKTLAGKRIMHLAVLYPYLLQLMEEYVFLPYQVNADDIKVFANTIRIEAEKVNNYEAMCYSIYYAIKHNFMLDQLDIPWVINHGDCVLLVMTWLYYLKQNHGHRKATALKPLVQEAKRLKALDMDRYWLFCYEVLTVGLLDGEWKDMKRNNVSIIGGGFI